jgi:glycosyltransferase involved in cell wall biosynthesis
LVNKLHLDGAIYPNKKNYNLKKKSKKNNKTIFFYSGSMHKWGGVKLLIDTMKYIKRNDFELWISGPGDSKLVKKASIIDNRIKFLGLLTDDQLKSLYQKADIFLNPRPIKMPGNEFNFPSKLFDYLAWNKPIISTFTKSLSPEYKNVLYIIKDNPKAFAKAMSSFIIKKKFNRKLDPSFLKNKSWKKQAQRLIFFINKIIKKVDKK